MKLPRTTLAQMIDVPCANCGWPWKSFAGMRDGKYIAHCSRCDGDMRHGKIQIVDGAAPANGAKAPAGQQLLFGKAQ